MSKNGVALLTPGALTRMSTGPSRVLDVAPGRPRPIPGRSRRRATAIGRRARGFEGRDPGVSSLGGAAEHRDRGAGVGKAVTDRTAEDAGPADDDRDPSVEIEHAGARHVAVDFLRVQVGSRRRVAGGRRPVLNDDGPWRALRVAVSKGLL